MLRTSLGGRVDLRIDTQRYTPARALYKPVTAARKKIRTQQYIKKIRMNQKRGPELDSGRLQWMEKRSQLTNRFTLYLILGAGAGGEGAGEGEKVAATSTHSPVTLMGTRCSVGRQYKLGMGACAYGIDDQDHPLTNDNLPRRLTRTRRRRISTSPPVLLHQIDSSEKNKNRNVNSS